MLAACLPSCLFSSIVCLQCDYCLISMRLARVARTIFMDIQCSGMGWQDDSQLHGFHMVTYSSYLITCSTCSIS